MDNRYASPVSLERPTYVVRSAKWLWTFALGLASRQANRVRSAWRLRPQRRRSPYAAGGLIVLILAVLTAWSAAVWVGNSKPPLRQNESQRNIGDADRRAPENERRASDNERIEASLPPRRLPPVAHDAARSNGAALDIPLYPQAACVGRLVPASHRQVGYEEEWGQPITPATPYPIDGIDPFNPNASWRPGCPPGGEAHWDARQPIPWQAFAQGEYIGPYREKHVETYRLRAEDQLEIVYRFTSDVSQKPYRLNVGDEIRVESITDNILDRDLIVQPDGTITLRLLGQVRAARRTVDELRQALDEMYKKYYKIPSITVTPLKVNTRLNELRDAVDARFGQGGLRQLATVTPEGTIQLPVVGNVSVNGLTLDELKYELNERYAAWQEGIEVQPVLTQRAPRYVYVVGEVAIPGRYALEGPTTTMQAIAMAGGWNNGGNLREIVVFRRAQDWRLMATRLDLQGALLGRRPAPADEIWLRDSDIVVVPKSGILMTTDFIELVFTRGIYGVLPFQGISINFSKLSTI